MYTVFRDMLYICQLHILLSGTAQISLELHFCVEPHTEKSPEPCYMICTDLPVVCRPERRRTRRRTSAADAASHQRRTVSRSRRLGPRSFLERVRTQPHAIQTQVRPGQSGATEIAGLDIVGPVWQGWTMTDDLRTGVIWLVIDVVDQ